VAGLPKEKLNKVWTHTLSLFGLLAAIVTIVSFLGYHPSARSAQGGSSHVSTPPKGPSTAPAEGNAPSPSSFRQPKLNGTGTLHLEGGFTTGQAMLTTDAIQAGTQSTPIVLTNSRTGRTEKVGDVLVPVPVDAKHPVAWWRKGTKFVEGIHMEGTSPYLDLRGVGLPVIDVPVDADGRLQESLVWPLDRMFTAVDYPGPVRVSGLILDGGVVFGDADSQEPGKTLPVRFEIDLPRPGEIMGAAKGDFTYPSPGETRYIQIEALSQSGTRTASWSSAIDSSGVATIRDSRTDLFSGELGALRVSYTRQP